MSLDFDLGKIRDYHELMKGGKAGSAEDIWGKGPDTMLESMIWSTMIVGMGAITEDNAVEFFTRLSFFERARGAMRTLEGKDLYFTLDEVRRCIGLTTNASRETPASFLKRIYRNHAEAIARDARAAAKAA